MSKLFRSLGADTNPADDDSPITTTPDVRLPAQARKKKKEKETLKSARRPRLDVTEMKKICVIQSVTR